MKITHLIAILQRLQAEDLAKDDELGVAIHGNGQVSVSDIHGMELANRDLAGTMFDGLPSVFLVVGEHPAKYLQPKAGGEPT